MEQKPEEVKQETKPQQNKEDKKERGERKGDKRQGGDKKQGDRRHGGDKRQGGDKQQGDQQQGDRKNKGGPRKQREEKYDYNKENVTVDTPVPHLPAQKDRVQLPNEKQMETKRAAIQKKIDHLFAEKRKFIEDLIKKSKDHREEKKQGSQSLRDTLKQYQDEKDVVAKEFNEYKSKSDAIKVLIEANFAEQQKIRRNMKVIVKREELLELIQEKQYRLDNETLTNAEEKRLFQELESLKKSLPQSEKLFPLEQKMEELTKSKKELGSKMKELFPSLQEARERVSEVIDDLDELRKMSEKSKDSIDPIIEQKKEEYQDKINKLRDEQKEIFREYKTQQRLFYEQKDLINYIEWLKRQKDRVLREKRNQKRDEERLQREQEQIEEEKAMNEARAQAAYQKDIDLCNQLIGFCQQQQAIHGKQGDSQQQTQTQKVEISNEQLQKEKITLIKSKKDQAVDDDFLTGTKKHKKNKKHLHQAKKVEESKNVVLGYQDLNDFSSLKISPPNTVDDLAKTIELLEEKKKYFENIPKEELIEKSKKKEEEEEAELDVDLDNVEELEKQQSVKAKNQKPVQIDNEEEYPDLG